ncbi:MAG: TolC family protein [Isosphaeraceae bacterium]
MRRPSYRQLALPFALILGGMTARAEPPLTVPKPLAGQSSAVDPANSEPPRRSFFGRFRARSVDIPAPPPRPKSPAPRPPTLDAPVQRVQGVPGDMGMPLGPGQPAPIPAPSMPLMPDAAGGQSISLQSALYGALTSNPTLVNMRVGNPLAPTAEAVEVARQFPTALNPTLWIDFRPINLIPPEPFGGSGGGAKTPGGTGTTKQQNGYYRFGNPFLYLSLRQPLELGHQTTHRYHIAQAAFSQYQWTVMQAEMTALVQTYRFFQTAAYRREKLRVARDLAAFNDRLLQSLKGRFEANQALPADVALAEVENEATNQLVEVARQDYATALTDLQNQIGQSQTDGTAEPLGAFVLPAYIPSVDDQQLIQMALESRPDIHALQAQLDGTNANVRLARSNRIPSPVIGPEYEIDEVGVQYIGLVFITPIPYLNTGKSLVRQRQAECQRAAQALDQTKRQIVTQVKSAVSKWNQANQLVRRTNDLTERLKSQVEVMNRLFEAGQTDVTKLYQARQRLIQLENARLDATWQATQSQADLLTALGAPTLINAMLSQATLAATTPGPVPPPPSTPSPFQPSPGPPSAR